MHFNDNTGIFFNHKKINIIVGTYFFFVKSAITYNNTFLTTRYETNILLKLVFLCFNYHKNKLIKMLEIGSGNCCIYFNMNNNIKKILFLCVDLLHFRAYIDNNLITYSNMYCNINSFKFDILICNPPYISFYDCVNLFYSVRCQDPILSLLKNINVFYHYNLKIGSNFFLIKNGIFILEIDINDKQIIFFLVRGNFGLLTIYRYLNKKIRLLILIKK